jgi:hypothetical protein
LSAFEGQLDGVVFGYSQFGELEHFEGHSSPLYSLP